MWGVGETIAILKKNPRYGRADDEDSEEDPRHRHQDSWRRRKQEGEEDEVKFITEFHLRDDDSGSDDSDSYESSSEEPRAHVPPKSGIYPPSSISSAPLLLSFKN